MSELSYMWYTTHARTHTRAAKNEHASDCCARPPPQHLVNGWQDLPQLSFDLRSICFTLGFRRPCPPSALLSETLGRPTIRNTRRRKKHQKTGPHSRWGSDLIDSAGSVELTAEQVAEAASCLLLDCERVPMNVTFGSSRRRHGTRFKGASHHLQFTHATERSSRLSAPKRPRHHLSRCNVPISYSRSTYSIPLWGEKHKGPF